MIEFDEVLMREVHAGRQADSKKPVVVHALLMDHGKSNLLFIEGTLMVTHASNIRFIRRNVQSTGWLPSWLTNNTDHIEELIEKKI